MRYPKVFEPATGALIDESGRHDRDVTVTVGEDRDGAPAIKLSVEAEDGPSIEAQLSEAQLDEIESGIERLRDE